MITRENIDSLLDSRKIEVAMKNGNWWQIRRNGRTKTWKRDASRICIPFKAGMYVTGQITESDFLDNGQLNPDLFRVVQKGERTS